MGLGAARTGRSLGLCREKAPSFSFAVICHRARGSSRSLDAIYLFLVSLAVLGHLLFVFLLPHHFLSLTAAG
jgi:hypothetical protein